MRSRGQAPPTKTLTDRQKFLLGTLPGPYTSNFPPVEMSEPREVKRARKIVMRWDKKRRLAECRFHKTCQALIRKAKESIYFDSEEKALVIVRQVNKMLQTPCEIED